MRTSVLAGESRSRGLISGRRSRPVTAARFAAAGVVLVLLVLFQVWGLIAGAALLLVVFGCTTDTGTGSTLAGWAADRRRWRHRVRTGFVDFAPVDQRPAELTPTVDGGRADRRAAAREWNRYRDWPDGVDGLYWLESRPGIPAVAYHAGAGEVPYLSAAFGVDGPIQGLHGDAFVARAQEAFGQLMAGWGAGAKLVSGIQVLTRVIPADSALHEAWLQDQLDPDAPQDLQSDYTALLGELSASSFVQRHYLVVRWNVDEQFRAHARRQAPGLDGWLWQVNGEIQAAHRRLTDAMYRGVHALSGPQLAAVLRHLQHPDWPIDRASDVTVQDCWLPSHDERAWTSVTAEYPDPLDPDWLLPPTTWVHRTAQIPVDALEVQQVDGLWLAPVADRAGRADRPHPRGAPALHPRPGGQGHRPPRRHHRPAGHAGPRPQGPDGRRRNRTRPVLRRPPDVRPGRRRRAPRRALGGVPHRLRPRPAPNWPPPARTWRPRPRTTPGSPAWTGWTPSSPPRTPPPGRSAAA